MNIIKKCKSVFLRQIFLKLILLFTFFLTAVFLTSGCSVFSFLADGIFVKDNQVDISLQQDVNNPEYTKNNFEYDNKEEKQVQQNLESQKDYCNLQNQQSNKTNDINENQNENAVQEKDNNTDKNNNNYTQTQKLEPEGNTLITFEDPTNSNEKNNEEKSNESLEKKEDKESFFKPKVSLQIILGPEYAQDNTVCYWRVKAIVSGNPAPEIKFSKDDSNGSWGRDIAQINLSKDQTYTLICEVKNSVGFASSSLTFNWIENKESDNTGQPQDSQNDASNIQIDYQDVGNFMIDVNLSTQRVTVLYKQNIIRTMVCSSGAPQSPTPIGNYKTYQKIYYAWVSKYNQGAYYWTRFYGPYLIHSVPFDKNGNIIAEEYEKLGSPASHGCIRLKVDDAKWLYETIPLGVSVVIHN